MENVIIYGAYGYTGKLIVAEAVRKGWKPTVAGRDKTKVENLAKMYDLPFACFNFDDQPAWDEALNDKELLLNCAGPFSLTIHKILPACIRNKCHYTDITGEIGVFEYIKRFNADAVTEGLVLMPGTGFDVVPTDCLSKHLHEQLPTATHLELAFDSASGLSRGTALSFVNRFRQESAVNAVRVNGVIEPRPAATPAKDIHFGGKDRHCGGIAWGDVFTAYETTGIPNIEVSTAMTEKDVRTIRMVSKLRPILKTRLAQHIAYRIIGEKVKGPSEEKRENLRTYVWGRASDAQGNEVVAELETPESYKLTAITAVLCAEAILNGHVQPGFQTPAGALGSDFILNVERVTRTP